MNKVIDFVSRYLLIILLGLGNLYILYSLFYPLTFYSTSFLLSLFGDVVSFYELELILFNQTAIELVNACIAGSAYFLLIILNFSTPNIKILKRIKMLLFSVALLFVLNVSRIIIMALIAGEKYFDIVHMGSWYFLSILFVIGIWFLSVRIFKIKDIPIYSDIVYLKKRIK